MTQFKLVKLRLKEGNEQIWFDCHIWLLLYLQLVVNLVKPEELKTFHQLLPE